MTGPAVAGRFVVREEWCGRLWRAWVQDAALLSAPFFLMLPLGLTLSVRLPVSAACGAFTAAAFLFLHKREHMSRHAAEALALGFSVSVRGSLWNPFGVPELLLDKEPGDPEEDRVLADLVVMHGPSYGLAAGVIPKKWDQGAAAAQCALALAVLYFPRLVPLALPLSGLFMLVYLLAKAEAGFAKFEDPRLAQEMFGFRSPSAPYYQWNFLSLGAKRMISGREPLMAAEIGRVLAGEAGFTGASAVMEAGAGGGFLWRHIPAGLRPGWVSVEKDAHAAVYARSHANGTSFVRADLKELPFADASFDGVAGLECFDSLTAEDLLGFLREAKRVLRPGGRLVHLKDFPDWPAGTIVEKLRDITMRAVGRDLVSKRGDRLHFAPVSPRTSAALAAAAGKEPPAFGPYAAALADYYAAGTPDLRLTVPMLFSLRVLEGFFLAAGFAIAADSMGPGRAGGTLAYIVAVKKA